MNELESILGQSTAVRSFVLDEVLKIVDGHKISANAVKEYSTDIVDWLRPVIDLKGFSIYPMNGITEALNWWTMVEGRRIKKLEGDYQWLKERRPQSEDVIWYQSIPSSIDGNFRQPLKENALALDLAYLGSTSIQQIPLSDNIEYVFYSLSKGFGLRNYRIGWMFTRKPDAELDNLIYGAKYYNYFATKLGEKIIQKFPIDYVFNKIRPLQEQICQRLDLRASDSVWLAHSRDEKFSKFRRSGDVARICLSPLIREEMNGI